MKLSKKESREILNNYEPMGICTLSNFGGITIYNIEYGIEDYIIYKWFNEERLYKSKLKVNKEGESVFRIGNVWYNLNEFIKVNI